MSGLFDHLTAKNWLLSQVGFTIYSNFRSNYYPTLPSNASIFNMKHHYYSIATGLGEAFNSRRISSGLNNVNKIFHNNGYKTYFLNQSIYIALNGCYFDECLTSPKLVELRSLKTFLHRGKHIVECIIP